ncbi:MAG: hypothetical protein M1816_003179 [Peltula sp. TS41687]|nr:MAG: hypothetical protein M1816_003179 [Peltula sp. TS41687]
MDSMRTLNTSLPSSSPKARTNDPPEQLLQAFRSAALSVTKLYKTAASEQSRARQTGYQDALEDLLSFLDSEHLGFGDGEGWKVRRWATERIDQGDTTLSIATSAPTDSDDEKTEVDRARSSSPVVQPEGNGEEQSSTDLPSETPESISSTQAQVEERQTVVTPTPFTFRSSLPMPKPQDHDMSGVTQGSSTTVQPTPPPDNRASNPPSSSLSTPSVRVEVVPRSSRHRNSSSHNNRMCTRSLGFLGTLGTGAGYKRKIPFGEFFDVTSSGNGRDGTTKRGRFTREPST